MSNICRGKGTEMAPAIVLFTNSPRDISKQALRSQDFVHLPQSDVPYVSDDIQAALWSLPQILILRSYRWWICTKVRRAQGLGH